MLNEPFDQRAAALEIAIPPGPRLGDVVVEADHLSKGYGDRVLIDDLSFKLPRGGIVGVIGPNGAGKTTLFRMITGEEKPDRGTLRVGDTVKLAYVDQSRDALDPDPTVWEEISDGAGHARPRRAQPASRAPTWPPSTSRAPTSRRRSARSPGGERNRLHLAKMLQELAATSCSSTSPPTTSTSTPCARWRTRCWSFAGCAVVISHDRWFLDRIATHMLAFEDEGAVVWFEGNYADYEADRKRRLGAEADQPHRLRYKRLHRS